MNNSGYVLEKKVMASDGDRFINCILDLLFVFVTIFIFSFIVVIVGNTFNLDVFSIWEKIIIEDTYLVLFGFLLFNYLVLECLLGRSFGKLITGTVVVNGNGLKPGFKSILIRTFCRLIPFDGLSFLGKSGRIWHDSLSKTYVVNRKALKEELKLFSDLNLIGNNDLN
jgi:uncharacterized RDD family membrane protein YckC